MQKTKMFFKRYYFQMKIKNRGKYYMYVCCLNKHSIEFKHLFKPVYKSKYCILHELIKQANDTIISKINSLISMQIFLFL